MAQPKKASFLIQALIFSVIMLVSEAISILVKPLMPLPSSVIGMVILFLLLCFKWIKLEQVEDMGNSLLDKIGFLFVPSGISVIQYIDVMKTSGIQITLIIFITTIVLLATTGWFAQIILGKKGEKEIRDIETALEAQNK
jgi:holin-like protein